MSSVPDPGLLRRRLALRRRIESCTGCDLRERCTQPVPFRGPAPAKIAIVGEAPGRQEDKHQLPFIGPAGELLDELLRDAGINPDECFLCNSVSCWPKVIDPDKHQRNPTKEQIAACRSNLMEQIEFADPKYVLLLGGVALSVFRPDLRITQARSRPFWIDGRLLFPAMHPAAALHLPSNRKLVEEDISLFGAIVAIDTGLGLEADTCVICRAPVAVYDIQGVAYCAVHGAKEIARQVGDREKRMKKVVATTGQGALEL